MMLSKTAFQVEEVQNIHILTLPIQITSLLGLLNKTTLMSSLPNGGLSAKKSKYLCMSESFAMVQSTDLRACCAFYHAATHVMPFMCHSTVSVTKSPQLCAA